MRLVIHPSTRSRASVAAAVCLASLLTFLGVGCHRVPGRPGPEPEVLRPDEVVAFPVLYKQNCAACHGEHGRDGAALPLANPVYLAVAGEGPVRQIIANGIPGSLMPPFARSAGGMLTDRQVAALAQGIVQTWGVPNLLAGQNAPSYAAAQAGDAGRGQQAFAVFCARCHGASGEGLSADPKAKTAGQGSIVDPAYLALVSDQNLRSILIAGLPDRNMPDWRSDAATPLTDQQVTDLVAWLASKRTASPGQPYPPPPPPTPSGAAQ